MPEDKRTVSIYSIDEFAKKIGITIQTLRDWDKDGRLKPIFKNKRA